MVKTASASALAGLAPLKIYKPTNKKFIILYQHSSSKEEFPVFTLCPSYQKSYKPEILNNDGLTVRDMRKFNYPKNKNSALYYQNVTHNITELIKSIDFVVNFPNPSNNKIRISFDDDDFSQYIRGNYSPTFGQCFSMEVPIWIKQLKVKVSIPISNICFNILKYLANIFFRSRLLNLLLKWTLIYMFITKDRVGILIVSLRFLSKQGRRISWKYFMTNITLYPRK